MPTRDSNFREECNKTNRWRRGVLWSARILSTRAACLLIRHHRQSRKQSAIARSEHRLLSLSPVPALSGCHAFALEGVSVSPNPKFHTEMTEPSDFNYKTCHRFNDPGDAHYITFSCYRRQPFLIEDRLRERLISALREACANILSIGNGRAPLSSTMPAMDRSR